MADLRRKQLKEFVEREFIGPDPIDWEGTKQADGEEILRADPPTTRYIAGVLYPRLASESIEAINTNVESEIMEQSDTDIVPDIAKEDLPQNAGSPAEYLEDAEELINMSNSYRQSAMSMTVGITEGDNIRVTVSAGIYKTVTVTDPLTEKKITHYPRTPISWNNGSQAVNLPSASEGIKEIPVGSTKLRVDITYRYRKGNFSIYTFTLENTNINCNAFDVEQCYFQVKLHIESEKGFCPLPNTQRINVNDEDYLSNLLLYRNVRNYAIGHGCAAEWDDSEEGVHWIETAVFPSHEVKPVVPSTIPGVSLEMLSFSPQSDIGSGINELRTMCDQYEDWISKLKSEIDGLEKYYRKTAERHVANCQKCLYRMRNGIRVLESNEKVRIAFQYMNLAMLMQQLHYNLPLQRWEDDGTDNIRLNNPIKQLPDPYDKATWYDKEHRVYGKWRPFQIAFVLMNLESMADRRSKERGIVDLIWFPTGGGKTEAYLGLSAYTIFIRRLLNKDDTGTAILMRYTLRLLTAQQYERASAMICACEQIRKAHENLFGRTRISIGLWVGVSTTPNKMSSAAKAYDDLYNKKSDENPFVILKCPWCGAQMGVVKTDKGNVRLPGYSCKPGKNRKKVFKFICKNTKNGCDFSSESSPLPLHVIDEAIYNEKPTLLLGTVDKFAMLPFRPEAQGIFGYYNGEKLTSPDLIIQDELHLISGPLGSMVGHYETLVNELCTFRTSEGEIHPKIIASTATISRAKEQCHALYGCGKNNVFQFPPAGLDAGNSFFAEEDKNQNGRLYVGILATGSSSDATTAIRLYSALLYGTKEMKVEDESERDPYWTNMGYYNSIRELGQARTWIRADIDQHLDVIYKRRFYDKIYDKEEYHKRRRYIWRDEELTSRIPGDKVTASLSNLNIKYSGPEKSKSGEYPIDICLATNMISVGLDVSRLGLMTVSGQPKTTSEYIQATSRVGRDAKTAPGLVFTLYRPGRPRDKSHYEHFKEYHSRLYCSVEPTSVTPFSAPVRERALHAIMIGMMRLEGNATYNESKPKVPSQAVLEHVEQVISSRIKEIDPEELGSAIDRIHRIIAAWKAYDLDCWDPKYKRDLSYADDLPLMYYAGSHKNRAWGKAGFETPTSMRSVDTACEASISSVYEPQEE